MPGREQRSWQDQLQDLDVQTEFSRGRTPVEMLASYRKPSRSNDEPRYRKQKHRQEQPPVIQAVRDIIEAAKSPFPGVPVDLTLDGVRRPPNPLSSIDGVNGRNSASNFELNTSPKDQKGTTVFNNEATDKPDNGGSDNQQSQGNLPEHGKLVLKTGVGDAEIPLKEGERDVFMAKAIEHQQAIINKEKANFFAVAATAAFSGLSALAVGVTIFHTLRGKKKINLMDV